MAYGNSKIPLWSIILALGFIYLCEKYGFHNVMFFMFLGLSFVIGCLFLWGRLKSILVRYSWGKRIVSFVNWVISLINRFGNLFPDKGPKHVDGDLDKMSRTEKWTWRILLAPITGFLSLVCIAIGVETMTINSYAAGGLLVVFGLVLLFLTWKIMKGKIKTHIVKNPKDWDWIKGVWRISLSYIAGFVGIGFIFMGLETMVINSDAAGGLHVIFGLVLLFLTWRIRRDKIKTTIVDNPKDWE
tara:strand:+ start:1205 stop:1933 length:729 start_codon:yes stop_codon:yes gene_type:complete